MPWLFRHSRWTTGLLLIVSLSIAAAPAPFFKWRSKFNGQVVCQRTSPGDGWERLAGPFRDIGCQQSGEKPLQRWDRVTASPRS
nr:hypothetical protein [Pseudomonas luteola]